MKGAGRTPRTCASCEKFPRAAVESGGAVACPSKPYLTVQWDSAACILHDLAPDHHHRKSFVIRLMQQKETNEQETPT